MTEEKVQLENTAESFSPIYSCEVNKEIELFKEAGVVTISGKDYPCEVSARMKFFPRPTSYFHIYLETEDIKLQDCFMGISLNSIEKLHLPEYNLDIPGKANRSQPTITGEGLLKLTVHFLACPGLVTFSKESAPQIKECIFNLFNFMNTQVMSNQEFGDSRPRSSVHHYENGDGSTTIEHIFLDWNGWAVELKTLPEASKTFKKLKEDGGFGLTHIGRVTRQDDADFEPKDIEDLLVGLRSFCSFVKGDWCFPVLPVGLNADGHKVWSQLGAAPSSVWRCPMIWSDQYNTDMIEELFPLFMEKWFNENWQPTIREAIYWLMRANHDRSGIDSGIILTQTALELLAFEYLVNDKKVVSKEKFENKGKGNRGYHASHKLKDLFDNVGIPTNIPSELETISELSTQKNVKWKSLPHALTEVRNSLVHPDRKKKDKVKTAYFDTWKAGCWLVELTILSICGYNGKYSNRITAKRVGEVEYVPWSTKKVQENE